MPPHTADLIRTDHLELLPLRVEHADELAVALADPALHTYIGGEPDDAEALRARYQRMTAGGPEPDVSWLNWAIRLREDDRLTGTLQATITATDRGHVAEIAWVVGTPWQGRGIAKEAAAALVDWLAGRAVRRVIAHVHPDHAASAAVAAAAGLAPTEEQQAGEVRWLRVLEP